LLIRVAVPVPQLDLLTYGVPDDVPPPPVGARVVVPLGSRVVTGIVVEIAAAEPGGPRIKPIRQLLDPHGCVPPDVVALAQWTADYYAAGVGETIAIVLPPNARGTRADAHKTRRILTITAAGATALTADRTGAPGSAGPDEPARAASDGSALTVKQREALEALSSAPGGVPASELAGRGIAPEVAARLVRKGFVAVHQERVDRDPFAAGSLAPSEQDGRRSLTADQSRALARLSGLAESRRFQVALMHGVTGSGKTEIYLRLAALVRSTGRQALVLVPEIALTPVMAALFRQAFGGRVAIQHSGLSDGERHDQWQRIRGGGIDVVIGTRSAVFAPLANPGLVVVDEEHDGSYKQEESPRYNARDVAIVRGQRAGALVVLGSATPSMESYQHAISGKYERIVLDRRVLDRPLASVTVVNMREEFAAEGPDQVLSRPLQDAIAERVQRREQALVLLNRRGFATAVFCRQCAGTLECPNCSVSLVVHGEGRARRACCHYCNYQMPVPRVCPLCAGPYLEQAGFGTERVEAEVRRLCPGARVGRLDRDAVRRRGALRALLSDFQDGALDVLVGTQMIAKGHDFHRVTLVGVVSADVGLGVADFRASERTFQLLTQVAGRAGRGDRRGEAIIQTLYPGHYSIQLACRQDYAAFFERELQFRRAMAYPPFVSIVNVIVRAPTFAAAVGDAAELAERVRIGTPGALHVLGPAPAPLARLKGEYRAQLLLKGRNRKLMREALRTAVADRPDLARRTVIDVDPLTVL
jgi:primosomal protein N' (replication factor Y)